MPHRLQEPKLKSANQVSKSIVFGEDDLDDEELLRELFSSVDASFSLIFINNGQQVIDFLNTLDDSQLPCLIVLDYNMPELNGADILHELKKLDRCKHIPKIIWSTSQTESYRSKCLELGANDYVIKPSKVNELIDTIKYMISFC